MELRQLRYFKAIAEAHSFAHGARYLRVAQPALSRSISKLEDEIGCALLVRHSGGVSLTDTGSLFYEEAVAILERAERLATRMADEEETVRGNIIIGAPQSIQSRLVTPVVADFLNQFPKCSIDLLEDLSDRLRDAIESRAVDIGIISSLLVGTGMQETPLLTENICLFASKSEAICSNDVVGFAELAEVPLIICGYPTGRRYHLEQQFAQFGRTPSIRSQVNSSALMLDLVFEGAGMGLAPSCAIAQARTKDMKMIPVTGLEMSWSLVTSLPKQGSRSVQILRSMIVDYVRKVIEADEWPTARLIPSP